MNDSTNVRVMADNIRKLEKMVKEAGSELPTPGAGDTGKILKVGSNGYELATDYATLNYSTEEQDTGVKWIDGKSIYFTSHAFEADPDAASPVARSFQLLDVDKIIKICGIASRITDQELVEDLDGYYDSGVRNNVRYARNNQSVQITSYFSSGTFGGAIVIVYYTKTEPAPTNETKKKTTKKG